MKKERWLIVGMAAAACVAAAAIALLAVGRKETVRTPDSATTADAGGAAYEDLPTRLSYGEKLGTVTDECGNSVSLSEACRGSMTVVFWFAGYCPHCHDQFEAIGTGLDGLGVSFCFVDRLDEKETAEDGKKLLDEEHLSGSLYFDENRALTDELGIQIVPTTIILDEDGNVVFVHAGTISGVDELSAMVSEAKSGGAADTLEFLKNSMRRSDGAPITSINGTSDSVPSGSDVLSESLGLELLICAERGDQSGFDETLGILRQYAGDGLPLWVYTDKQDITADSLLDNLRILKALRLADGQWQQGGYGACADAFQQKIQDADFSGGSPRSFSDGTGVADEIELPYLDLETLGAMDSQYADEAETVIDGGYLGDGFPFYASSYSDSDERYSSGDLNMSEALYTVLHLAEHGTVRQETIQWLTDHVTNGRAIYTSYDKDGNVTDNSQSAAVYALAGLIGILTDSDTLRDGAMLRMETFRTYDSGSTFNGSFGISDSGTRYSFDQLLPLLFYVGYEK